MEERKREREREREWEREGERGEKVQQYISKVKSTIVEILRVNMFTKGYFGRL